MSPDQVVISIGVACALVALILSSVMLDFPASQFPKAYAALSAAYVLSLGEAAAALMIFLLAPGGPL